MSKVFALACVTPKQPRPTACCDTEDDSPMSLGAIVKHYEDRKRLPHHRIIRKRAMKRAPQALLAVLDDIDNCCDFDSLFSVVKDALSEVERIGKLFVYDVAHR